MHLQKLPSYEKLVIELHATLECLTIYSNSEDVKILAEKRIKEINRIRKNGGGFYLADAVTYVNQTENKNE